jgi:UDP-4-amino-4,6-dideoxy-N-acetyl-beta-L-altrosamine transaminase
MVIPYARQSINQGDIDAVVEVLKSDYLTQGPVVPQFESAVAYLVHAKHAVTGNSATSLLHIACLALGVGKGDIVWTSPISFAASANCALYCGAEVDFVDVDPDTFNMSVTALAEKLETAKKTNSLPKVIIPVHMGGQSCEMEEISALARKHGISIIEDASHAIGGFYNSQRIGDCAYSDITVFSFHPVKIITTGEGGMATTQNDSLAEKMRSLRSHGITRDEHDYINASDGPWYYEQQDLGFNYRLTDIAAALGISQLSRIDSFIETRNDIAKRYDSAFSTTKIKMPRVLPECTSAFHLYICRFDFASANISRIQLFESLKQDGVMLNLHYIPIYRHPYYQKLGFIPSNFPHAEQFYAEAFSIPMFVGLDEKDQESVVSQLLNALITQ